MNTNFGTVTNHTLTIPAGTSERLVLAQTVAGDALTSRFVLEAGAQLQLFVGVFTDIDWTCDIELVGDNSSVELQVLYVGRQNNRMTIKPIAHHQGRHTQSRMRVDGLALDNSQINFAGNITIEKSGAATDAYLGHEGILLGSKARIQTLPGLAVDTNDVKAAHSSAVHFVRPEQLFYLQSRGLNDAQARDMIVRGFVEAVLSTLADADKKTMLGLAGL